MLLIAFCTGIFFYAEWQKKQFDEALPKPPRPAVHVPAEHEHSNSGHAHEEPIPHHEETHEQTHVHEPLSTVETDEGEFSVTERTTETVSNAETTPSDEVATKGEKPRRKYRPEDFNDPYKRVEMMRPALIAMNGDIPEVEEFLDLELRIATAPVYTAADRLKHAELQASSFHIKGTTSFWSTPGHSSESMAPTHFMGRRPLLLTHHTRMMSPRIHTSETPRE